MAEFRDLKAWSQNPYRLLSTWSIDRIKQYLDRAERITELARSGIDLWTSETQRGQVDFLFSTTMEAWLLALRIEAEEYFRHDLPLC